MEQVKIYSKEEIEEMKGWLQTHDLPQSLQLDKATYISNVKETLESLFEQVDAAYNIPQLQGYANLLSRIKAKLEA